MAKRRKKKNDELANILTGIVVLISVYVFLQTQSVSLTIIVFFTSFIILLGIQLFLKKMREERLKRSGIHEVDRMSGYQFEKYLSTLFKENGYKTRVTKSSGDYGADLIIKKSGITTVVQAKRYNSTVGLKAVQEIVSSVRYYKADKALVVTSNYFSKPAEKLANSNNVELIDRNKLINMMLKVEPKGLRIEKE